MFCYRARSTASFAKKKCEWKQSITDRRLVHVRAAIHKGKSANLWLPTFGQQKTRYDISEGDDDKTYWSTAFEVTEETPEGYWVEDVEGQIPLELHGTFFRNGPGDFNFLDEPVVFPFDANGIVASVAIKDGKAFFRSRFVKTRESMMEEMAGRRLFKGFFGTIPKHGVPPIFTLAARTAGNGMTFLGKDKLYAADEGSELTELDPFTLETVWPKLSALPSLGIIDWFKEFFSGPSKVLKTKEVAGFGDNQYDGCRNVTVCHGYQIRPKRGGTDLDTKINFYEIDEDLKLCAEQQYTLDGISTVHSIAITKNYYIVNKYPMHYDLSGLFDPNAGILNYIRWDPSGTHEFHLVPRPSYNEQNTTVRRQPRVYKMEKPSFLFHFINAYEEDGNVVVDGIHYPEYPDLYYKKDDGGIFTDRKADVNPARWWRTICSSDGKAETHEISTRRVELPNVNPSVLGQRYRYAYLDVGLHPSVSTQAGALGKVKLDSGEMEVWTKGPHYFVGEPLFVPRPNSVAEDDGWLMAFCYNGKTKKSEFVIFDARNVKAGPVATLYLNHAIGHGFHGHWTNKYFGPMNLY